MASDAALLELVDAAIEARLAGRPVDSYSGDGIQVQYMSLTELKTWRSELQAAIAATSRSRFSYADMSKRVT